VEMACYRLTAPGIGSEGGATFDQNRLLYQGLFLAPQMVGEAMKGSHLIAYVGDKLGYPVNPLLLCLDAILFKRLNSVPPIS